MSSQPSILHPAFSLRVSRSLWVLAGLAILCPYSALVAGDCGENEPQRIATLPDGGPSGYFLRKPGTVLWRTSTCAGEFQDSPSQVLVRGHWLAASRVLAGSCDTLNVGGLDGVEPNVVRDGIYLYWLEGGQVLRKAVSAGLEDPATPVPGTSGFGGNGRIELFDGRLYWSQYRPARGFVPSRLTIYTMPTDGSAPLRTLSASNGVGSLIRLAPQVYYPGDSLSAATAAFVFLTNDGRLVRLTAASGIRLELATGVQGFATIRHNLRSGGCRSFVYAMRGRNLDRINLATGESTVVYTATGLDELASVAADSSSTFSFLGTGSGSVFLSVARYRPPIPPDEIFNQFLGHDILRHREHVDGDDWELIVCDGTGTALQTDDDYLWMVRDGWLTRLDKDVAALEIDYEAIGMEVVQAVQNLENDVPLIARRETHVRAYAHLPTNTSGKDMWFPEAFLRGFRGGEELPESPLLPRNNVAVTEPIDLGEMRSDRGKGFLYRLPRSWTERGALRLEWEVNPGRGLTETGSTANNEIVENVVFESSPAPCIVLNPVRVSGAPTYRFDGPRIGDIFDRGLSLLPLETFDVRRASDVLVKPVVKFEVQCTFVFPVVVCPVVPVIEYRPYDWDDDLGWALAWLSIRNLFSSDPSGCGRTHWLGMIHPNAGVGNVKGGVGGVPGLNIKDLIPEWPDILDFGIPDTPVNRTLIVHMRGDGDDEELIWNNPRGGRLLAHELGHNFGRGHIIQDTDVCHGNEPDVPYDNSYPYDSCQMGPVRSLPSDYFGFDPIGRQVIAPDAAADLMSYASAKWSSDYFWRETFDFVSNNARAARLDGDVAGRSPMILLTGLISPVEGVAQLGPFYVLPANSFDRDKRLQSLEAVASLSSQVPYFLRFEDAEGRMLSEAKLLLAEAIDGEQPLFSFSQFAPFEMATQSIALVSTLAGGEDVLARLAVSQNAPVIQLETPVYDAANRTLSASWEASDADGDELSFVIQYSRDGGARWEVLRSPYRFLDVTLDASYLAGSEQARLRVVATDGVLSSAATSAAFTMPKLPPDVMVCGLSNGDSRDFGMPIRVRALVTDAEDGSISEGVFWTLEGPTDASAEGDVAEFADLPPGAYELRVQAVDSDGMASQAELGFEILPLVVPDGPAPELDGLPNDEAYETAAFVQVPLQSNRTARAWLTHADGHLYVAISGLRRGRPFTTQDLLAGIQIDVDASGDSGAQTSDIAFFVDRENFASQSFGDGTAMERTLEPLPGFDAVVEYSGSTWSAELRIADELIGGWNHAARIQIIGGQLRWPLGGSQDAPADWAPAYFGSLPELPNRAPRADAGVDQRFASGEVPVVYLDGTESRDPDLDTLTYSWTRVGGPAVVLSDADTSIPSFEPPSVDALTTWRFRLVVSDGALNQVDEVSVSVYPARHLDAPGEGLFRRGDINSDGGVAISDASFGLGYLFLGTRPPTCFDAADANDSGVFELADNIYVLNFLFNGGAPIPAPGPTLCGGDLTADSLPNCEEECP